MSIPSRRAKVWVAVPLVLNFVLVPFCTAGEKATPDPMHVLQRLGTGHTVSATLKDGTSVKGKLVTIDGSSFGLDRGKKMGISTLSYSDVASVRRDEITKGEKIALGVGDSSCRGRRVGGYQGFGV
jgi:hypothetical protein